MYSGFFMVNKNKTSYCSYSYLLFELKDYYTVSELSKTIDALSKMEDKLKIKKLVMLDKALRSDDPNDIMKAQSVANQVIQQREHSDRKSYLIDPNDFVNSLGFRNKKQGLSYDSLKRMGLTPIINAIIKTRINQVAAFAEPQKDKYSTGFIITKKELGKDGKMSEKEKKRAQQISEIILNCGVNNSWSNDDFDTFTRKVIKDSLVYDQLCFEVVDTKNGDFFEMVAVDAATVRLADTFDDDSYQSRRSNSREIRGYYPSFVQVYEENVTAEYYPWEMCFGIRNPDTSIRNHGYGISELEELIQVITAILWSDEYNRKFFSQGSAPKGILRVDSSVSPGKLQEFKQQWQAMVSGVYNAWKTPILEAGKMDFVNLQTSNRDMEYGNWIEYLVKLSCAIYSINPEEVNFTSTGSQNTVFESNNENKLKNSKDKGLYPLLKFYQARLNKFVVDRIDPEYRLEFVGYDSLTKDQEIDLLVKKVTNLLTLDEAREELDLKPLNREGISDQVMSGTFAQFKMQAEQPPGMGMDGGEESMMSGPTGEGRSNSPENMSADNNPYTLDNSDGEDSAE